MKQISWIILAFSVAAMFQCSTPNRSLGADVRHDSQMNDSPGIDNPANRTLADLLRRVPGVEIRGNGEYTEVSVRGAALAQGETRPLYVINGTPAGRSYADIASLVVVEDVSNIRVKKGAQARSLWGQGRSWGDRNNNQGVSGLVLLS